MTDRRPMVISGRPLKDFGPFGAPPGAASRECEVCGEPVIISAEGASRFDNEKAERTFIKILCTGCTLKLVRSPAEIQTSAEARERLRTSAVARLTYLELLARARQL